MLSEEPTYQQLAFSIDVDSNQTGLFALPVHLKEVTHGLLQDLTLESALRYLTELQSALSGKYAVKHYSLLVTLEKVPENVTVNGISGAT